MSVKEYQLLLSTTERKRFILLIMIQLGCPRFNDKDTGFEPNHKHTFYGFSNSGHPIEAAIYQIGYNNKPDQRPKVIRPRLVFKMMHSHWLLF